MNKKLILSALFILSNTVCFSQIKLPKLISDGMILQRSDTTKIWGWASPNEKITLSFKGENYPAVADKNGDWFIKLAPQKAGGPYEMTFTASNKIIVKNILFGDVWICSGQSNMELPMSRLIDKYPDAIANSSNPAIRQFLVPDEYDFENPRKDVSSGKWESANPESVLNFSGVAYFFALEINKKYNIPVGIINSALGGSPAQSWISENSIKKFSEYYAEAVKFKDKKLIAEIESADKTNSEAWYKQLNSNDIGLQQSWKSEQMDDKNWPTMNIPGYWANTSLGQTNGTVWFRKEIIVPKTMVGKQVKLVLGRIVDADEVFINGVSVGTTGYQYPPRRYMIPANILKEGKNTITVRIINNSGNGGFVLDKEYNLTANKDTIDLKGAWKYKLGVKIGVAPAQTFVRWKPVGLYNAMIAPLQNYRIKGALWYQGEANTAKATEYGDLMKTLISDWRANWHQGNFPFLYVQLPGYMEAKTVPAESNWAVLREQQRKLSSVENTAMAVAIDLGEWNDIHPLNKKSVGHRLALQAEYLVYGNKKIIYSGPELKSTRLAGNKIELTFNNIGSGLMAKGSKGLNYFSIAGNDNKFIWAKTEIKGDKIVVWNDDVKNPVRVRYAWADNPEGANLYNKEGLPASPFEATVK